MEKIRIDKWLWAARFFKTRTLASKAVEAGHAKLNGARCKPSHEVRVGDVLELTRGEQRIEARILGLSAKRGPAPEAQNLYEETEASVAKREASLAQRRDGAALQAQPGGRPTKRDRRHFEQWLRSGRED